MNTTRTSFRIAGVLLGAGIAFQAVAEHNHAHSAKTAAAPAGASAALVDAEVRKIDKAKGEITLKHGPMPKFDMPAMTMAYRLKDKAMLDGLKPGDRIKFDADGIGGAFTVTHLERVK